MYLDEIKSIINSEYGIDISHFEKINIGVGTDNWKLHGFNSQSYFLKIYPPTDQEFDKSLQIMNLLYLNKFKIPKIFQTKRNELSYKGKYNFSIFDFLSNGEVVRCLNKEQMFEAGSELGKIHVFFKDYHGPFDDNLESWFSVEKELQDITKCEDIINFLKNKKILNEFDRYSLDELLKKRRDFDFLKKYYTLLRGGTAQVIHGDFTCLNLLFNQNNLTAVLDFHPPRSFLISWEIGRMALNVDNLNESSDWMNEFRFFIRGYLRKNNFIKKKDLELAPIAWLVQLTRSSYGVWNHYFFPHKTNQKQLDLYWRMRCLAKNLILDNLTILLKIVDEEYYECRNKKI